MKSLRSSYHATFWTILALALLAVSAIKFQLGPWPHEPASDALPYLLGGFLAAGLGVLFRPPERTTTEFTAFRPKHIKIRWLPFILGILALMSLAESNGQVLISSQWVPDEAIQVSLMIGGSVLLVLAFWDDSRTDGLADTKNDNQRLLIWTGLVLITLLGLVLRVWHLETAIHQFVDEMNFGRAAWGLRQPDVNPVPLLAPFSDVAAFPWLYPYWQSISIQLIGWNLSALRLVSIILGTLSIPALYFLVSTLFNRRLALVAALLLATFPPHIHFSRMGINNIADPLAGVLMLAFLARGLQSGRQRDFALAGVCLGMTQYFYEGGRVVYPLLAIGWLGGLVILRRLQLTRPVLQQFIVFGVVGIMVAAPLYYTLFARDLPLLSRFRTAGVGGSYWTVLTEFHREQTLAEHLTRPLLIYVRNPDLSEFYGGKTPLLLVSVMPFFLLGLADSIWQLHKPRLMLPLMWLALVSVGGMILAESGHAARFVVAFPAAVILVMIGIWRVSLGRFPILIMIVMVLSLVQANYYFNDHLPTYNDQRRQSLDYQDALFRVADLPDGAIACFVTNTPPDSIMITNMRDYLAPQLAICQISPADLTPTYLMEITAAPKAFIVDPADSITPLLLYQVYGAELVGPLFSPYDSVPIQRQYHLYLAP